MGTHDLDPRLADRLRDVLAGSGGIVVLTGAGISAESGIPTFRGPEGYWTVGSREYRPEEMATAAMFSRQPDEVWQWYLYRLGVCRGARPNAGHLAVRDLEEALGGRFRLITQNVDGLHVRAGSSLERTYRIHGDIEFFRCAAECSLEPMPLPPEVSPKNRDEPLTDADRQALRCPRCGGRGRPHVLWFDECYDEERYRFESSIRTASEADLLITVGTSGATNLPMHVGSIAARRGALLVDVNPDRNPFSELAEATGGFACRGPSGEILPGLASALGARDGGPARATGSRTAP
jgi:NAD-dependent deacetylase